MKRWLATWIRPNLCHHPPGSRTFKAKAESLEERIVMDGTIGLQVNTDIFERLENFSSSANTTLSWDPTCDISISDENIVTIDGGMATTT